MHWKRLVDSIIWKQTYASGVIPQITAVFGTCGGGMAIVPASDRFYIYGSRKRQNCL